MKRSDMRHFIRKELNKHLGNDASKYIAEDILYLIEMAGMLPPWNIDTDEIENHGITQRRLDIIFDQLKWETED